MSERGRTGALLAGAAGGSLLTYFLTRGEEARAAPAGVDQELWNMLLAMLEAQDAQIASINNLIQVLGGVPAVPGEDPFENTDRFVTGHVVCTILNQAFRLPSFPVPKNKQLVIKADPGNVGWIYVGLTQGSSQNLTIAYPLIPNEGVGLFINCLPHGSHHFIPALRRSLKPQDRRYRKCSCTHYSVSTINTTSSFSAPIGGAGAVTHTWSELLINKPTPSLGING